MLYVGVHGTKRPRFSRPNYWIAARRLEQRRGYLPAVATLLARMALTPPRSDSACFFRSDLMGSFPVAPVSHQPDTQHATPPTRRM